MTAPIRVLVVDDDQGARALHCAFVDETPGFVIGATAATGAEAVARAKAGIDLVLLDMRLPDISGIEVLHRLRTMDAESPDVLVISSSQDQTTVRQALAAHVAGYLVKPFTQDVLQDRLAQYGAKRRAARPVAYERPLGQGDIDRLLATGGIRNPVGPRTGSESSSAHARGSRLPKGLAEPTLARVVAALDPVLASSTKEVATSCDLSPATAHRYLIYLVEAGVIDLAHRYGRRGRPEVLYRLATVPPDASSRGSGR